MRCKCCDTENNFQIFDIDRLGNPNSGKFEALITCNICNSSMSIRFDNVLHEKDLIKRIKKLTRPRKGGYHTQEVWGYNWSGDGYDFSSKKKVVPFDS